MPLLWLLLLHVTMISRRLGSLAVSRVILSLLRLLLPSIIASVLPIVCILIVVLRSPILPRLAHTLLVSIVRCILILAVITLILLLPSMPILHRGKLVGLIDPSLDRKEGMLTVRSMHLMPGEKSTPVSRAPSRASDTVSVPMWHCR